MHTLEVLKNKYWGSYRVLVHYQSSSFFVLAVIPTQNKDIA